MNAVIGIFLDFVKKFISIYAGVVSVFRSGMCLALKTYFLLCLINSKKSHIMCIIFSEFMQSLNYFPYLSLYPRRTGTRSIGVLFLIFHLNLSGFSLLFFIIFFFSTSKSYTNVGSCKFFIF